MRRISKLLIAAVTGFSAGSAQAHEGHAIVGSMLHEFEHAGWIAGALMLGSVLILLAFNVSVRFADTHLSNKKRRE